MEQRIEKEVLQKHMDTIETRLLWIAGSLRMMSMARFLPVSAQKEMQQRFDDAGIAMDAVQETKQLLGLAYDWKIGDSPGH